MKKQSSRDSAPQAHIASQLISALSIALAATLLPLNTAQAQAAPKDKNQPIEVDVQGHSIPSGPHCVYMNLATLPVKLSGGLVTVNGTVNGSNTAMVVVTGSEYTELSLQAAEKLGLKVAHTKMTEFDAKGKEEAIYAAYVGNVALGKNMREGIRLGVAPTLGASHSAIAGADIVLGSYRRDVEFSLATSEIKFLVPTGCDNAFLAYWDDNASTVPLTALSQNDPRQLVTVEVNGHEMVALIDSGAPTSLIDLAAAERVGVTPKSAGVTELTNGDGIRPRHGKTWLASFSSFAIGGETIKNPAIGITDLWGMGKVEPDVTVMLRTGIQTLGGLADRSGMGSFQALIDGEGHPDMLLGADFLRCHRVLFAMSQRRKYFTYLGGKVFNNGSEPNLSMASR